MTHFLRIRTFPSIITVENVYFDVCLVWIKHPAQSTLSEAATPRSVSIFMLNRHTVGPVSLPLLFFPLLTNPYFFPFLSSVSNALSTFLFSCLWFFLSPLLFHNSSIFPYFHVFFHFFPQLLPFFLFPVILIPPFSYVLPSILFSPFMCFPAFHPLYFPNLFLLPIFSPVISSLIYLFLIFYFLTSIVVAIPISLTFFPSFLL